MLASRGKKNSNSGKIIVGVILFTFIASMFAIADFGEDDSVSSDVVEEFEYKGHTFYSLSTGAVVTKIHFKDTDQFVEVADPRDMEDITIGEGVVQKIMNANKLYITYNPNGADVAQFDTSARNIKGLLEGFYVKEAVIAYTEDKVPVDPDTPIKTCADATEEVPVIMLSDSALNEVELVDNCIILKSTNGEKQTNVINKLAMWLIGLRV